jgi:hypothetical protein
MSSQTARYFSGQELVERWRIKPAQLSHCLILGLPAFFETPYDIYVVSDPDPSALMGLRTQAWQHMMNLPGRVPSAPCPKQFESKIPTSGPIRWMYFRLFESQELFNSQGQAVTKEGTIKEHLALSFRLDDVFDFEKQYGLYGFNDHSDLSSGDIKGNDEKIENLPMVPPGRLQEAHMSDRKLISKAPPPIHTLSGTGFPLDHPKQPDITRNRIRGSLIVRFWNLFQADFLYIVVDRRLQGYDDNGLAREIVSLADALGYIFKIDEMLEVFPLRELDWRDRQIILFNLPIELREKYPRDLVAGPNPNTEPPGRKPTQLTKQAKSLLNEISPAITEFCEKLKARIQDECETLANASADDWEEQALSMLEDSGKWDGIITKDDIGKISFAKLAKSEHKERLKSELAQSVLEREGCGLISRKTLKDFVK